jgi:hypothetical protein
MRGLWDHEQPLSPSLLRSALALAGGVLAALAAALAALGIASAFEGRYLMGLVQGTAGLSLPFAAWLGLKMLADILTVLNRSHDRLDALGERTGGEPPSRIRQTHSPRAVRASDDGPTYPED